MVKEVEVSIVHANIPFLLGRDYLDKWNCQLLFQDNSLILNNEKKVKLESNHQGHFTLNLVDAEVESIKIMETLFTDCGNKELKDKIKKIHIMSAHKVSKRVKELQQQSKTIYFRSGQRMCHLQDYEEDTRQTQGSTPKSQSNK